MKRREFLTTSLAAATTTLIGVGCASSSNNKGAAPLRGKQEYFELRAYRMKPGQKPDVLHRYLERAAVPAWGRIGLRPIGVFTEVEQKDLETVFVLIPYASLQAYAAARTALAADSAFQAGAAEYSQLPKTSPAYDRIDSWLMLAFAGMPKLALPPYSPKAPSRIFELRTYESYSEAKAQKKVDMFNAGEIETMREVGLAPVFFGQALTGPNLPHLTYMTSGENEELHKQHWDAFGKHPTWDRLKNDPQYADTVSKITKWMLKPVPYSQI